MTRSDDLRRQELVPIGGTWSGHLLDNPRTGYDLTLSWTFTFDYEPVRREYGTTKPSLNIDWVPFERCDWRRLVGNAASSKRFAEPIESSVYFFDHYRYDEAEVRIVEQQTGDVRVSATVRGDIDGLGLASLEADRQLRFQGIYVQPSSLPDSLDAAESLLSEFTNTTGLVGLRGQHSYVFEDAD